MARVDTLEWADETGGELKPRDRLHLLIGQGLPTQLQTTIGRFLTALKLQSPIDLSAIGPDIPKYIESQKPSTRVARSAEALCRQISEPWLFAHCYRTYAFGTLLGRGSSFDAELFFVAAMLHDVGLTSTYQKGASQNVVSNYTKKDAPFFAVRGAGVGASLARNHQWPTACAVRLAEAISIHANVRVKRSQGVEAHLLNLASALDVLGLRIYMLPAEAVRAVEEQWPRGNNFRDDLWTVWAREANAHPECRGKFLNTWGSFRRRMYGSRSRRFDIH